MVFNDIIYVLKGRVCLGREGIGGGRVCLRVGSLRGRGYDGRGLMEGRVCLGGVRWEGED